MKFKFKPKNRKKERKWTNITPPNMQTKMNNNKKRKLSNYEKPEQPNGNKKMKFFEKETKTKKKKCFSIAGRAAMQKQKIEKKIIMKSRKFLGKLLCLWFCLQLSLLRIVVSSFSRKRKWNKNKLINILDDPHCFSLAFLFISDRTTIRLESICLLISMIHFELLQFTTSFQHPSFEPQHCCAERFSSFRSSFFAKIQITLFDVIENRILTFYFPFNWRRNSLCYPFLLFFLFDFILSIWINFNFPSWV